MRLIIETSRRLDRDDELGISLVQVGDDPKVTEYLKALDDQLLEAGAKFDIVDTITMTEMGNSSLSEVLLKAITD
jgi:hypothetical protein